MRTLLTWSFLGLTVAGASACGSSAPPSQQAPTAPVASGTEDVERRLESSPTASEPLPTGRLPEGVTPLRYALDLEIVPSRDGFAGTVDVRVRLDRPTSRIFMHGAGLTVSEAWVVPGFEGDLANGPLRARPTSAEDARWEPTEHEGLARLAIAGPVGPGEVTIHLRYAARFDRQLKGLYRVDVGGEAYAFTQFEPTSARHAFPSFDEPRFKTPFDVTLRIPADARGFANTREIEREPFGELQRLRFAPTEPLPTYLVAMAVGPFDVVEAPPIPANDVRSAPLPFRGICPRGRSAEMRYALEHTPAILASIERWVGVAYPYDKLDVVAVPDFASGAMENAGLVTFREQFLLLPPSPGEDQRRAFTSIMAHELAHQWFGNLVTMPWWDELWLNEAFATFVAARTVADVAPEQNAPMAELASTHAAMAQDALASARRVRQPIESDHDVRNAFDAITYQKGAAVIAMFERFLGAETFRAGLRDYLERHRFGTARAEDLLLALGRQAGRDVASPFSTFLDQPGVPLVTADLACGEGGNVVALTQERFIPLGSRAAREGVWQIPVCVRFGRGREVGVACTLLQTSTGRLPLPAGPCPEWFHPNADAGGYYRFAMPADDLDALVTRGLGRASPRERLSVANGLRTMLASGAEDAARLLPIFARLVQDEERLVVLESAAALAAVVEDLADDAVRPSAQRWVGALLGPRFARLGWRSRARETGDVRLLRRDLAALLVRIARSSDVIAQAARLGRAYVGRARPGERGPNDGAIHPEVLEPELAGIALVAAVNDVPCFVSGDCGDASPEQAAFFDHLVSLALASEDATLRQRLLVVAASTEAPDLARRVLDLALDARLRVNEIGIPMGTQAETRAGRARVLAWMQAHLPQLRERMATTRLGWVPWTFAGACSREERDAVAALFSPHIDAWPGGPRNLAGVLEAIDLCVARRERHAASVRSFLETLGTPRRPSG